MTKLTYVIKTTNGSFLREEGAEKIVEVTSWGMAQGLAKMTNGTVIPRYTEEKTY